MSHLLLVVVIYSTMPTQTNGKKTLASGVKTRALTPYNKFVRDFAKKHTGTGLMVSAGKAWQIAKRSGTHK
jgi:hypothetical protein